MLTETAERDLQASGLQTVALSGDLTRNRQGSSVRPEVRPDLLPMDRVCTVGHLLAGTPGSSDICYILRR